MLRLRLVTFLLCLAPSVAVAEVGQVSYFLLQCPTGWAPVSGQTIGVGTIYSSYTLLTDYAIYYNGGWPNVWVTGNNFKLPDLRGEFLRGFDDGRGIDSRVYGSTQTDTFQSHVHESAFQQAYGTGAFGRGAITTNGFPYSYNDTTGPGDLTNIPYYGGSYAPRTSTTTRPRNVALSVCVKISSDSYSISSSSGGDVNIVSVSTTVVTALNPGIWKEFTSGDISFWFGVLLACVVIAGFKAGGMK